MIILAKEEYKKWFEDFKNNKKYNTKQERFETYPSLKPPPARACGS